MRRAAQVYLTQIIQDVSQSQSVCSTSGRQALGHLQSWTRSFGTEANVDRFDWFDPRRDVYKQFQAKWDQANAAAAAAKAALEPPPRGVDRHRPRGLETARAELLTGGPAAGIAAATASRSRPPPVAKDADWPPGYDELLAQYLAEELPFSPQEAGQLVEAARRGLLPASRELIRMRYMHILDLEPRFPGFHAHSAVLSEPRLLRHSASKLMTAMTVFQDQWSAHPVGPLMATIGKFIVSDPIGAGHRLHALARALAAELGVTLDPRRLTRGSAFMTCSPLELDARVSAVATIFGRHGATRLLDADIDVLCFEPQELNGAVITLRDVFSVRGYGGLSGYGGRPRYDQHHAGTPEGAAAAAADRAYVTDLAVAWPGVLRLPGWFGKEGLAAMVAAVAEAGGERYAVEGGRALLLSDLAARPEVVLQGAAEAAAAVGTDGEERARRRLRQTMEAVVRAREAAVGAVERAAVEGRGGAEGEALAGLV